jgi:outer membrane protein OmpA-like peptidoglycan-associated protein
VPDGIDKEPDTPVGAVVDSQGISLDDDGDGIADGLDREADTPDGADVDEYGVSLDTDGDGVPDGLDKEPNTPRGILVDTSGRALIRQEYSLLRDGMIRLNSITFSSGSNKITEDSYSVLDDIGKLLRKYSTLKIQISGHTDRIGNLTTNYRLSRDRALAVRNYLLATFPDIGRDRLMAVGFGPDKPIAPNSTSEGRRQNRRVEFVVINQEELMNINHNP